MFFFGFIIVIPLSINTPFCRLVRIILNCRSQVNKTQLSHYRKVVRDPNLKQ